MGSLPNFLNHSWPTSREHERKSTHVPVQVKDFGTVLRGWCDDVGIGGMGFTLAGNFAPGDRLDVEFSLPDDAAVISTTVVVRWSDGFRHGCEFLKLSAEITHAINAFLARKDKKKSQRKQ